MSKLNLIEKTYSSVVKRINEEWFLNSEFEIWYNFVINDLTDKERTTYLIVVFHEQVINGGLHQYFVNGYGQFAPNTIGCLKNIGATEKAKILRSAFGLVNDNELGDYKFRKSLTNQSIRSLFVEDDLYEPLGKLDNEFYNSEEEIEHLLVNYLIK